MSGEVSRVNKMVEFAQARLVQYLDYRVDIPEGESGDWRVKRFIVSEDAAKWETLRAVVKDGARPLIAGEYTGLYHKGQVIMSDTPIEVQDHMEAINMARGNVLINGLGIGMYLRAIMDKPEVRHITVVELSQDVLDLVSPHYFDPRVKFVQADAFEYKPKKGERFDFVWHDIWPTISDDNLPEMAKLKRKYSKRADMQSCWAERECRREQRRYR